MAAHRVAARQKAQTKQQTKPDAGSIQPKEVEKVYKALGLDTEATRQRYLDWYDEGRSQSKVNFEIVERGDTRSFE